MEEPNNDGNTLILTWNEETEQSRESFTSGCNSSSSADAVDLQRDISLEFIEDANEQKFERLVKQDKLKTVFKRRHSQALSGESRSNSPIDYMPSEDPSTNPSDQDSMAATDHHHHKAFLDLHHKHLEGKCHNGQATTKSSPKSSTKSTTKCSKSSSHFSSSNTTEKRFRQNSRTSSSSSSLSSTNTNTTNSTNNNNNNNHVETDSAILARRQKQIDYGKNTIAYERYLEMVPKNRRTSDQPRTPNKYGKYSRRAFDGLIKIWRKKLHLFDPPQPTSSGGGVGHENGEGKGEDSSSSDSDSD